MQSGASSGCGLTAPTTNKPPTLLRALYRVQHHIYDGVGYATAARTEPLCVAYNAVAEKSEIHPGDTVAIIGPGPVGLFSLQVARLAGAGTIVVTGTGRDRKRSKLAEELGADIAVDVGERGLSAIPGRPAWN